jgi:hypothetical protein
VVKWACVEQAALGTRAHASCSRWVKSV